MKRFALILVVSLAVAQSPLGQITTRDVHALLWLPDGRIVFGHHDGLQVSLDGGGSWQNLVAKPNWDAMNLAWDGKKLVVAGHEIFLESSDLKTFRSLRYQGLPGLDLHGYAVNPKNSAQHYAWEARLGLFASRDGGKTWEPRPSSSLSQKGMVHALAVGPDGTVYATGMGMGLYQSRTGGQRFEAVSMPENDLFSLAATADGFFYAGGKIGLWQRTEAGWKRIAPGPVISLAVNPVDSTRLVWIDGTGRVWRR